MPFWVFALSLPEMQLSESLNEKKNGNEFLIGEKDFGCNNNETVLLITDLLTNADNEKKAIEAIKSEGLAVRNVLALINAEQIKRSVLCGFGYEFRHIFTMRGLLSYYVKANKITARKHYESREIMDLIYI